MSLAHPETCGLLEDWNDGMIQFFYYSLVASFSHQTPSLWQKETLCREKLGDRRSLFFGANGVLKLWRSSLWDGICFNSKVCWRNKLYKQMPRPRHIHITLVYRHTSFSCNQFRLKEDTDSKIFKESGFFDTFGTETALRVRYHWYHPLRKKTRNSFLRMTCFQKGWWHFRVLPTSVAFQMWPGYVTSLCQSQHELPKAPSRFIWRHRW